MDSSGLTFLSKCNPLSKPVLALSYLYLLGGTLKTCDRLPTDKAQFASATYELVARDFRFEDINSQGEYILSASRLRWLQSVTFCDEGFRFDHIKASTFFSV